jgi:acyl-coenzyme A synthetase/AMP-(fatty) acid ligase
MKKLMPRAECHTPYGMTEVLPVADIDLTQIDAAGPGRGVCVGLPLPGVDVAISALDDAGSATGDLTAEPGVVGEVCIRSDHMKDAYDRLWVAQHASANPTGWHRSGDVGRFDDRGRLWIEGRLAHLIVTADGPLTPLPIEQAASAASGVATAAAVGVGPSGTQAVAIVVVPKRPPKRSQLASEELAAAVRGAVDVDIAAVLCVPGLPVDLRHNAKVDRIRLARWAGDVLAGGRMKNP